MFVVVYGKIFVYNKSEVLDYDCLGVLSLIMCSAFPLPFRSNPFDLRAEAAYLGSTRVRITANIVVNKLRASMSVESLGL